MPQRVLVVEDDAHLGRQVVDRLRAEGFEPTWVQDGNEAMGMALEPFALLVLDLMLPGAHGFDILKRLRAESEVPVLVLSARNDTRDKVRALELGADDYVTKPFWPEELVARIGARLRRPALQQNGVVRLGDLAIDVRARQARVAGQEIELTRVEFDLLAALAQRPGAAVARAWLVDHVLDPDREGTERTLDVHVSRLRKKLGRAGRQVATVWGVGYRLETAESQ
jgi:DNA-binding response OmpR family regulator